MPKKDELTSVLLKRQVNALGELHLDKVFTKLLIEMIEIEERQLATARKCISDLHDEIIKATGGAE